MFSIELFASKSCLCIKSINILLKRLGKYHRNIKQYIYTIKRCYTSNCESYRSVNQQAKADVLCQGYKRHGALYINREYLSQPLTLKALISEVLYPAYFSDTKYIILTTQEIYELHLCINF
jgi:hypothetical protein